MSRTSDSDVTERNVETRAGSLSEPGENRSPRRGPRLLALVLLVAMPAGLAIAGGVAIFSDSGPDPGRSSATTYEWSDADGTLPEFTDVTDDWQLSSWKQSAESPPAGGAATADLDGNDRPDLVVAGGDLAIFFADSGVFERATGAPADLDGDATSVTTDDIDNDGLVDIVVGTTGTHDLVIWGGDWADTRNVSTAQTSRLEGGLPTMGVLAADLTGDRSRDVLRLGYGPVASASQVSASLEPTDDVIFEQVAARRFEARPLPGSDRRTLAAEIADIDGDRRNDIWATRDIGWIDGGNSVYTRAQGDDTWSDIAGELGIDLEIDGMGVTLADFSGDGELDAYLTDIGENEMLERRGSSFVPQQTSGTERIRPPAAADGFVSSSWAPGVADLNLDGNLDLVVANGGFASEMLNKIADTDIIVSDPPAILLGLGGGRFADVWGDLGLDWSGASRGMTLADLDRDGDTDIVIVNHDGGLRALRNDTDLASLTIRPEHESCDTAGVTVQVESGNSVVKTLARGHTFVGAHAAELIVGNTDPDTEVDVRRPDGGVAAPEIVSDGERSLVTYECD